MRLVSWNVNGRVGRSGDRQRERLLGVDPHVIALQEVTPGSYPAWCDALLTAGYSVLSSIELVGIPYPATSPAIGRRYFNVIASRLPVARLAGLRFEDLDEQRWAFPEKYLAARVRLDAMTVDVHDAHLPPGSTRGLIKVQMFRATAGASMSPSRRRACCAATSTPRSTRTRPA